MVAVNREFFFRFAAWRLVFVYALLPSFSTRDSLTPLLSRGMSAIEIGSIFGVQK